MNTTPSIPTSGGSPFDGIKQTRPDGTEFWSARDLMPVMGYSAWRNLETPIQRAMTSAANVGHDLDQHFARSRKVVASGPGAADFLLTRFAAYLLAMNCDPNKPEVAAAQAYFAVKTREAETTPAPIHPDMVTRADLARMILEAEEEKAVLAAALKSAEPAIAYHDRYVSNDDAITVKVWGAQYGLTVIQAYQLLLDKGIVYKQSLGERWSHTRQRVEPQHEYRARAGRVTFAYFDLRPQHNAPRHHNGQVRQTLYVRQEHALDLAIRAGLVARKDVAAVDGPGS